MDLKLVLFEGSFPDQAVLQETVHVLITIVRIFRHFVYNLLSSSSENLIRLQMVHSLECGTNDKNAPAKSLVVSPKLQNPIGCSVRGLIERYDQVSRVFTQHTQSPTIHLQHHINLAWWHMLHSQHLGGTDISLSLAIQRELKSA